MMASKVTRFAPPKIVENPEPGAYDVTKQWTAGKRRTGTMKYVILQLRSYSGCRHLTTAPLCE